MPADCLDSSGGLSIHSGLEMTLLPSLNLSWRVSYVTSMRLSIMPSLLLGRGLSESSTCRSRHKPRIRPSTSFIDAEFSLPCPR